MATIQKRVEFGESLQIKYKRIYYCEVCKQSRCQLYRINDEGSIQTIKVYYEKIHEKIKEEIQKDHQNEQNLRYKIK